MNTCVSRIAVLVAFLYSLPASVSHAQKPTPVMEMSSILTSLDVYHHDGRLQLEDDNAALSTVFLPAGSAVDIVITKAGSGQPLHTQTMAISQPISVFNRLEVRGNLREFKFTEPGDYVATYRVGNKPMTIVPFSIEFAKNDDEFNPKTHVYANGPWDQWAYLFASVNAGAEANPQVHFWVRKKSFLPNPPADKYSVQLKRDGDVVAVSDEGFSNSKKWQFLKLPLKHPESKGGRAVRIKELTGRDGTYQLVIHRNAEPYAAFQFEVRSGKPVPHSRQASNYQPRTEYIVPRFPGLLATQGDGSAGHAIWMKRLSDADATSAASQNPVADKPASEEVRQRWTWLPRSIDPNRPFALQVTDIETRNDTGFAAGEDMVVFGTGYPNGVKYMKVGDSKAREIPDGETYNSKVFGVCGTKIVLVKKNQIVIFDTANEKLSAIPESEVSLYDVRSTLLATNGFLVGTVNKVANVKDRTIIKVIDVSGDAPKIILIKNGDYLDSDVSSLSIDAKHGTIAISSSRKKLIAAANIVPLANQHIFDLADYRGVNRQQIFLEEDWVTYADEDWKVRLLDLGKGASKAITDEAFASSGNGFYVRKGRLVVATTAEKVGARYRFAIGDLDDSPSIVPGTGAAIAATSGGLGMAGCAAIAIDKTVFIAGNPGDGIGVGEHLQVLDEEEGTWIPIKGKDGKVIAASDAVTSMGFLAFKVLNESGKTVVGHATYGQRVNFQNTASSQASPDVPAVASPTPMASTPSATPGKVNFEIENIHFTQDEADEAMLSGLLTNEPTILAALSQSMGAEGAKKELLKTFEMSLRSSEKEYLLDELKRRSSAVSEADKPKLPAQKKSDADPVAVEAALTGQWKPERFVAAGEDMPDEALETLRLTFAGGKYIMMIGANIETGTYEIDASKSPHWITINIESGKNQGQSRRGAIKLLEGDQLLAVFATNDKDRETKFFSNSNNKAILAAYQRVK